mmetsp:Transcript_68342/g.182069  ORF Transcript_68342/g.182069 Transcript_68342/m.182069 type:complete len:218 (+) Transcript_68342:3153-3806(+)
MPTNSWLFATSWSTARFFSAKSPRKSPSWVLLKPSTSGFRSRAAMARGSSCTNPWWISISMPFLGFRLNWATQAARSILRFREASMEFTSTVLRVLKVLTEATDMVLMSMSALVVSSVVSSRWISPSLIRRAQSTMDPIKVTIADSASIRSSCSCWGCRLQCSAEVYLPWAILARQSMVRSKMFFSFTSQSKFRKRSRAVWASVQNSWNTWRTRNLW